MLSDSLQAIARAGLQIPAENIEYLD